MSLALLQVTRAGHGRAVSVADPPVVRCWPLVTTWRRAVSALEGKDRRRVMATQTDAAPAAAAPVARKNTLRA